MVLLTRAALSIKRDAQGDIRHTSLPRNQWFSVICSLLLSLIMETLAYVSFFIVANLAVANAVKGAGIANGANRSPERTQSIHGLSSSTKDTTPDDPHREVQSYTAPNERFFPGEVIKSSSSVFTPNDQMSSSDDRLSTKPVILHLMLQGVDIAPESSPGNEGRRATPAMRIGGAQRMFRHPADIASSSRDPRDVIVEEPKDMNISINARLDDIADARFIEKIDLILGDQTNSATISNGRFHVSGSQFTTPSNFNPRLRIILKGVRGQGPTVRMLPLGRRSGTQYRTLTIPVVPRNDDEQ